MNKRFIVVSIICIAVLSGCGVSKSDYESLEKRVRKLEEKVGVDDQLRGNLENEESGIVVGKETGDIYSLENMSAEEVVHEVCRLLNPDMVGKKPEEFLKTVGYKAAPQGSSFFDYDGSCIVPFPKFGETRPDKIDCISYEYNKNMDGTFATVRSVQVQFYISDFSKAESIYNALYRTYFSDCTDDRKNGTKWMVQKNVGSGYLVMEKKTDDTYFLYINMGL